MLENRHQTTIGEDTVDWEDLLRSVVNFCVCVCKLAIIFIIVTICKWSLNPIANSNPVCSHPYT
jgi:hypothetical protein